MCRMLNGVAATFFNYLDAKLTLFSHLNKKNKIKIVLWVIKM